MAKGMITSSIMMFVLVFALNASIAYGLRENNDALLQNCCKAIKFTPTKQDHTPSMSPKILDPYKDMIKNSPAYLDHNPRMGHQNLDADQNDMINYAPTDPGHSPGMGNEIIKDSPTNPSYTPSMGHQNLDADHNDMIKYAPTDPGHSPGMGHKILNPYKYLPNRLGSQY